VRAREVSKGEREEAEPRMGKGWGDERVERDEGGGRLAGGRESMGTIVGGGEEGGGVGAQGGSGVILKREGKGVC
jgi:hypothetical protein